MLGDLSLVYMNCAENKPSIDSNIQKEKKRRQANKGENVSRGNFVAQQKREEARIHPHTLQGTKV